MHVEKSKHKEKHVISLAKQQLLILSSFLVENQIILIMLAFLILTHGFK
jgi:hypothetical protein